VPILDDLLPNPNRTVCMVLTNAQGNASVGSVSVATLTIVDDDGTPGIVSFSAPTYTVDESGVRANVTVVRINGRTGIITVDYAARGGTALAGVDFEPRSDTLSFGDGETVQTIVIPIYDDSLVDGSKTVMLTLTNATGGASLTNPSTAVLIIQDNDFGPGSLDPSFAPGAGANGMVRSVGVYPDRSVVVGGFFTMFDNTNRNYVARLRPDGALDQAFAQGTYIAVTNTVTNAVTNAYGVVTFVPTNVVTYTLTNAGANAAVTAVGVTPDGRAVLGGMFTSVNGAPFKYMSRLHTNGAPDLSYNKLTNLNAAVNTMVVQGDGKVVIGGGFSQPVPGVLRVRPDGNPDISFSPGLGADRPVHCVFVHTNGDVVIGGSFNKVNGLDYPRLARFYGDGMVDPNFLPVSLVNGGTTGTVYAVAVQADGRILMGGDFTRINGVARNRIARLQVDGSLDPTFDPGTGASHTVYALAIQPDGKAIIGGDFTSVNGTPVNRFARLLPNGALDTQFYPGLGADNTVYSIVLAPGGDMVIGGDFTVVNGLPRRGVARLFGDSIVAPNRFTALWFTGSGQVMLNFNTMAGEEYVFEASTDLLHWTPFSTNTASGSMVTITDTGAVGLPHRFYRARQVSP
jgi:uncharacterized delta-60 repeat protein